MANDEDLWNDIEDLELILKEPKSFGIFPETAEGRLRYEQLKQEHEKLLKQYKEKYIESGEYDGNRAFHRYILEKWKMAYRQEKR